MFKDASKSISTYLIPVLCVLYIQFPILRNLIILHMIPISIIGVANAVIQERTPFEKIMIILGHLVFYLLLDLLNLRNLILAIRQIPSSIYLDR